MDDHCPIDGSPCPTCDPDGWRDDDSSDDTGYDRIARSADILRTHGWDQGVLDCQRRGRYCHGLPRCPACEYVNTCPDGPHWGCHNLAHREQAIQHAADPAREH